MTPSEIRAIRASFRRITQIEEQAGRIFYNRLFLIAPELRPMFKENMTSQEQKFVDTLALIIGQLRYSSMLDATLKSLGERHALYGVEPEHYEQVAEALIWTVENCLAASARKRSEKRGWHSTTKPQAP